MFNNKSTKIIIRIVAVIIALLLVVPLVANVLVNSASAGSTIDQLQDKIEDIAKQQDELKKSINSAKSNKANATEQKKQLDSQMNLLQQEIDAKEELISEYNGQISSINSQISDVQSNIDSKMDQYYARARANFENGTASYLEMLFSSENFSDFLVRLDMIEAISASDTSFVNDLENSKAELATLKSSAEDSRSAQQALKSDLDSKKAELSSKINESSKIISDLDNGITNDSKQLEEADAQWDKLNKELEKELSKLNTSPTYVGGEFMWPTSGVYKISCKFGSRIHPITKKQSFHYGVDIAAAKGTPILASNGGTVITAMYSSVYGNYVIIDHGGGKTTLYAHMTKYTVSKGQSVSQGETIGYVGSTGWSTGAHLHFEIRIDGVAKDPLSYFNINFTFI